MTKVTATQGLIDSNYGMLSTGMCRQQIKEDNNLLNLFEYIDKNKDDRLDAQEISDYAKLRKSYVEAQEHHYKLQNKYALPTVIGVGGLILGMLSTPMSAKRMATQTLYRGVAGSIAGLVGGILLSSVTDKLMPDYSKMFDRNIIQNKK